MNKKDVKEICAICQKEFISMDNFLDHSVEAHSIIEDPTAESETEMDMKDNIKIMDYICTICQNEFISMDDFLDHSVEAHSSRATNDETKEKDGNPDENPDGKLNCYKCRMAFDSQTRFKKHMSKRHSNNIKSNGKNGTQEDGPAIHRKKKMSKPKNASTLYACTVCGREYKNIKSFMDHMISYHSNNFKSDGNPGGKQDGNPDENPDGSKKLDEKRNPVTNNEKVRRIKKRPNTEEIVHNPKKIKYQQKEILNRTTDKPRPAQTETEVENVMSDNEDDIPFDADEIKGHLHVEEDLEDSKNDNKVANTKWLDTDRRDAILKTECLRRHPVIKLKRIENGNANKIIESPPKIFLQPATPSNLFLIGLD